MEKEFEKKLIASEEKTIEDFRLNIKRFVLQLQSLFEEAKKYGITLNRDNIDELREPTVFFKKELDSCELKNEKFVFHCKQTYQMSKGILEYIIIKDSKVSSNDEAVETYLDNYRYYITDEDQQNDFENTVQLGKLITSARRFTKNKYSFLALKKVAPEVVDPLIQILK